MKINHEVFFQQETNISHSPNKPYHQSLRRYPSSQAFSSSGLILGSHEREPPFDVRSHSTFRRCSLQFKRGSTIIGGIPFDIKCLAFVTRSCTTVICNGRKSPSFFFPLFFPPFFSPICFLSRFFPLSLSLSFLLSLLFYI